MTSCSDSASSRPWTRSVSDKAMSMPAETPAPLTWLPCQTTRSATTSKPIARRLSRKPRRRLALCPGPGAWPAAPAPSGAAFARICPAGRPPIQQGSDRLLLMADQRLQIRLRDAIASATAAEANRDRSKTQRRNATPSLLDGHTHNAERRAADVRRLQRPPTSASIKSRVNREAGVSRVEAQPSH
jgi:hypothetical protein